MILFCSMQLYGYKGVLPDPNLVNANIINQNTVARFNLHLIGKFFAPCFYCNLTPFIRITLELVYPIVNEIPQLFSVYPSMRFTCSLLQVLSNELCKSLQLLCNAFSMEKA